MHSYVVADASVFIILDKVGHLTLLQKVYGTVFTTPVVADEYGKALPDWVIETSASNQQFQELLALQVDAGEASAIALAMEKPQSLLILDDLKARKFARHLGLTITGTLGVIQKAKSLGVVDRMRPIITAIQETDFRIAQRVVDELLKRNQE